MSEVFFLTAGDLLPTIEGFLEDEDGSPLVLADAEAVSFHLRASGAASTFLAVSSVAFATATAGGASCGHVEHAWRTGAVPTTAGAYQAQFRAHFTGSRAQTVPNPGFIPLQVHVAL